MVRTLILTLISALRFPLPVFVHRASAQFQSSQQNHQSSLIRVYTDSRGGPCVVGKVSVRVVEELAPVLVTEATKATFLKDRECMLEALDIP